MERRQAMMTKRGVNQISESFSMMFAYDSCYLSSVLVVSRTWQEYSLCFHKYM